MSAASTPPAASSPHRVASPPTRRSSRADGQAVRLRASEVLIDPGPGWSGSARSTCAQATDRDRRRERDRYRRRRRARRAPARRGFHRDARAGPTIRAGSACGRTPTPPRTQPRARELGAEGIGLCRTEHMFFGSDREALVRDMFIAGRAGPPRTRPKGRPAPTRRRTPPHSRGWRRSSAATSSPLLGAMEGRR